MDIITFLKNTLLVKLSINTLSGYLIPYVSNNFEAFIICLVSSSFLILDLFSTVFLK